MCVCLRAWCVCVYLCIQMCMSKIFRRHTLSSGSWCRKEPHGLGHCSQILNGAKFLFKKKLKMHISCRTLQYATTYKHKYMHACVQTSCIPANKQSYKQTYLHTYTHTNKKAYIRWFYIHTYKQTHINLVFILTSARTRNVSVCSQTLTDTDIFWIVGLFNMLLHASINTSMHACRHTCILANKQTYKQTYKHK